MNNKTILASSAFAIIPFIDLFSGIITLALLVIYIFISRKHDATSKIVCISLISTIILSAIINTYYGYNILHIFRFEMHNILTDIGANIGVSFAIIILTTIGLILLWENGLKTLLMYIFILAMIIASLFNDSIRIYMNFIIMIYAGFALIYLNKRKWSISIIKKTTILLIICSIFFSTLVYTTKLVRSEPTPEYIDELQFIKNQSLPNEVILSSPSDGYFIEYYTNRMVLVDDSTKYYDINRYEILGSIASSRNLDKTEKMLKEYNIKYVIIGKEFEPYLTEKEGLLFLIETSKKFTSIYKNEHVEIWMYTE